MRLVFLRSVNRTERERVVACSPGHGDVCLPAGRELVARCTRVGRGSRHRRARANRQPAPEATPDECRQQVKEVPFEQAQCEEQPASTTKRTGTLPVDGKGESAGTVRQDCRAEGLAEAHAHEVGAALSRADDGGPVAVCGLAGRSGRDQTGGHPDKTAEGETGFHAEQIAHASRVMCYSFNGLNFL